MIKINVIKDVMSPQSFHKASTHAETILATQIFKDTRPFVPALTMSLNNRSHVLGNTIVYPGPYARYLHEGKVMVDSVTGRGAFYIEDVGFRFRRGATLVPTNRDLVFTKTVHPDAQAHWMDASERVNLSKWERVLGKAVKANV